MTVTKYTDFNHFARDLFINAVGASFYDGRDRFDTRDALPIVDKMSWYCSLFQDFVYQEFLAEFEAAEYRDFRTEEMFLRYAIPRCLYIINHDVYFNSLMVVSAFLIRLLELLRQTRRCYRFHMVAYKCYVAVFKRAFESTFDSHGGFIGLELHLDQFRMVLLRMVNLVKRGYISLEFLEVQKALCAPLLMSGTRDCFPSSDDFVLNNFELSMLALDRGSEFLIENFEYGHDDPLEFIWPITPLQVRLKLDRDLRYFESLEEEECSYLFRYASALESQARCRMSHEELYEKMRNRMCPCCRIRCYLFSSKLYGKQLALSLKKTPTWKKYLLRLIRRCRERLLWLVHFFYIPWGYWFYRQ